MSEARTRVQVHGTLCENTEIWSTSFNLTTGTNTAATKAHDLYVLWLADVWSALASKIGTETTFDGVSVTTYNSGGIVTDSATYSDTPEPGSSGANSLPPEVAEVISLSTATTTKRGRGRMYFPPLAVNQVAARGLIVDTAVTALADAFQAFFDDLNGLANTGNVVVYSAAAGLTPPVTSIRVGNVFDTQRRRRNGLIEAYASRALA